MSGPLRILLCGDVMTGRGIDQVLPHPSEPTIYENSCKSALDYVGLAEAANGPAPRPAGYDYPWGDALAARREANPDLVIVNLETAITHSSRHFPKGINYRMNPSNVACLTAFGINACALANNHALDWGRDGLADTLGALARAGIASAGAGRDLAAARAPAILDVGAGRRALLIACATADSGVPPGWAATADRPGVNLISLGEADVGAIGDTLNRVRRAGDVAIVSIHWAGNWGYEVKLAQRRFARRLIERAGVSIIHGHSSHHPNAIEVVDERLVLYGSGDFLNDYEGIAGYETFRSDLVAAYHANVDSQDGRLRSLEILPFQIRRFRLQQPSDQELDWFARRLGRECVRFGARIGRADGRLNALWRPAAFTPGT